MVNLIRYLQNPNLSIHDEHYADHISLLGSNTKDGFVKTATTIFCRLFWENDSNEGKGQDDNQDIELASNTNKNQEYESLFQRLQPLIKHFTNYTPTQLETFDDNRSQVSQLQTVINQAGNETTRSYWKITKQIGAVIQSFIDYPINVS